VFITNDNPLGMFKVMKLHDKNMQKGEIMCEEFITPREDQVIDEFDAFEDFIAVYVKSQGIGKVLIHDLRTDSYNLVGVDDEIGEITPSINQNYNESKLRFSFSSPLVYDDLYEYDNDTGKVYMLESNQLHGPEIVRNRFITEQVEVPAHDGEAVPMTLIYNSKITRNRTNKCLINGYGAYGLSMDLGFNIANLTAVEKGWVVAMAHVRGGNEKGMKWHQAGKLKNKMNSVNDFISCTEHLIAKGFTHPNLLAAKGESAGGMLIAQVCNLRPELYRAAVLKVPFLDVVNTLADKSLSLTLTDYLEFGNPFKSEEWYRLINSYSPFENIKRMEYPALYLDISLDDPRVPAWGSLK